MDDQKGFIQRLAGGKTAVSAQHDDLVILERIGNLVRHLRRAGGKFLGHHRDFLEQIGGFIVNRHELIAGKREGNRGAWVAVTDRQGRRIQVNRAMDQQFGGGQRHAAVVFIQAGLDQVMRLEVVPAWRRGA